MPTLKTSYPVIGGNFSVARLLKTGNTALIVCGDSIWSPNPGGRLSQALPLALQVPITGIYSAASGVVSQTYNDPGGNVGDKTGGQSIFAWEQFFGTNNCLRYCMDKDSVAPLGGWHYAGSSSTYDSQDVPDIYITYSGGSGTAAYSSTVTQAVSGAAGKVCWDDTARSRMYIKTTSGTFNGTNALTMASPAGTRTTTAVTSVTGVGLAASLKIPTGVRRQWFGSTPGAGVAICKVRANTLSLLKGGRNYTTKNHGDFTAQNVAVNAGLVVLSSSDSPSGNCNFVTYRNGVQITAQSVSLQSSPGNVVKYTSALDATSTSSNIELQLQIGSATITADTHYVNFMGATLETPNATTGCFPISVGNAGWSNQEWLDTAMISNAGLSEFLTQTVGVARTWVVVIPMLQNVTTAENTDLNAGNTDVAVANLIALAQRWQTVAALAGASVRFIFTTPYETYDSGSTPAISKTDTAMNAIVESHWLAAQAVGGLFINMRRASGNARLLQAGRSNTTGFTYEERVLADSISNPNIHPNGFVGSRHFATHWAAAIEQASESFNLPPRSRRR